ncbi:hypothetical protein [Thioalkalivibrio sp.]|uniref:flagellin N-terminal helical domain-containing protein n=1 Tax=Thioalkalivibrio sp. TaxID=2093813 RepID=UPI00397489D1
MSQVINTNVLSLTAQRNLQTSQSELATSLQRLSSGLRINSAKDDAAGLAISERFTTQIRGLNQAIRNANDGISLSQTGEAALATVTDNLQRIRELAVQSVNATNSDTDRATLQQEVQQRLSEIDRIAGQTSFNGRNVLDGTFGEAQFQVGANVGQTINLDLSQGASVRGSDIGSIATATSVDLTTLISAGSAEITGSPATFTFDVNDVVGVDYSEVTQAATGGTATFAGAQLQVDFSAETVSFDVTDGTNTSTVTRIGHKVFILVSGVRLPVGAPFFLFFPDKLDGKGRFRRRAHSTDDFLYPCQACSASFVLFLPSHACPVFCRSFRLGR